MKTGSLVLTNVPLEERCHRRQNRTRWETAGLCTTSIALDSSREKFIYINIYII